ncbi:MAG: ABC transporter ATP-binding protein/permease [Clostridiales bacterium]|jgi:ATP-binding cassette subfamily B protein|nr:ABC transporter ATP-binding protein/permease [Clostridiales bacterium]
MKEICVPDYMKTAFSVNGVPVNELVFAIHTDMTLAGDFSDAYVAVSNKNLYVLYGIERIVKVEDARRLVAQYDTHEVVTFSLADLGELKTETLLSTCRLVANKNGEEQLVLLFTLGHQSFAERLIRVVKNVRKGEEPLHEIRLEDVLFCPECGTRYPEPERALCPKCTDQMSIFFRLLGFFKYYKGKVAACTAVMFLITIMQILAPYVGTRLFIDDVLHYDGRFYRMVGLIVIVIVLVRIMATLFQMAYQIVLAKTMPWIIYDLQVRIFEAMQRLSVSFYTSKRTGSLMNRIGRDARNIYWFFVDGLPFIILNFLLFVGIFAVMFSLEWRLALICLAIMPVAAVMFYFLWKMFHRYHHKFWVINSLLNNMVSDSVNGQRVIKAFAREGEESGRFKISSDKQAEVVIDSANLGWTAFPVIYLFLFFGQVAVTALGAMMVINGEISLGVFLAFLAYLGMLYGPLQFMATVSNWWARCVDAAQRVFEVIDAKTEVEEPKNPVLLDEIRGEIKVKDVYFQYEPAVPILKGLNIEIPAGKSLGIVGKTGSGKSTLANLIARLYDPNEGKIFIDGIDIKKIPLQQLRANIGIVSQDIYLFIGSIAENIRYARPDASIEEVIWAAKMASAHDFIANLPDGYETRVGAGGQDLSGGEKQRLSIARTIIQNPKILILDEATAAMDTETESKIQTALNKLQANRTTISIAHRMSTLKDVDNLAVIRKGRVVEYGTHAELMQKKGEYHKLFMIQLEGLKVITMD